MHRVARSFFLAFTVVLTGAMAHADTISSFQVAGAFESGGTLAGAITIDQMAGTVTGATINVDDRGLNGIVASETGGSYLAALGAWEIFAIYLPGGTAGPQYSVDLLVPTSSMALAGGPVCSTSNVCGEGATTFLRFGPATNAIDPLTSGTVSPAAAITAVAPEPASLMLLGTGAIGLLGAGRRRFAGRA